MILFLDFDGVLHPAGGVRKEEQFSRLPLLEVLLRAPAYAGVRIVVSSTWRQAFPLERLRAGFSPDVRNRVISVTPTLDEFDSDHERHEEIRAWLKAHPAERRWTALDDDRDGFPDRVHDRVVFTDPAQGLTERELVLLRQRLQTPQS